MKYKKYKGVIFLLIFSFFNFNYCASKKFASDEQLEAIKRVVDELDIDSEFIPKKIDAKMIKDIHKFVIKAKREGLLDEDSARILLAYSLLTDISFDDAQKFVMAVELSGVLNQTRAVNFTDTTLNNRSSGNGVAWFFGGTTLMLLVYVLVLVYYDQSRNNKVESVKHELKNAFAWACLTGENWFLKVDRAVRDAFEARRREAV